MEVKGKKPLVGIGVEVEECFIPGITSDSMKKGLKKAMLNDFLKLKGAIL